MAFLTLAASLALAPAAVAEYRLVDQAMAPLDRRLFGQFMERPSWGNEIGIEAAVVPGTRRLRPDVLAKLRDLHIPILRFPHGTDNDYVDWTDMIDRAPGRANAQRPITVGHTGGKVTNHFGYDEFLNLAADLKSEVILPVRFRDGLLGLKPLQIEARQAAALAAYVIGREGQRLPDGLEAYVKARVANGRKQPWKTPIFQIGNETWFFFNDLRQRYPADPWGRYVDALEVFVKEIHRVDPKIQIIADGVEPELSKLIRKRLGSKVHYLADHYYAPWELSTFQLDGQPYPVEKLTRKEIWQGWTSVLPVDPATGRGMMTLNVLRDRPDHGYPVAITEWNFNGWWTPESWHKGAMDSSLARGFGAAGMLHALMRRAADIKIATQSMTVGRAWGITAIHVWDDPQKPAQTYPSGLVVGLYSKHHGENLMNLEERSVPTFKQPYKVAWLGPYEKVQALDLVATGGKKAVYLHALNRSFDEAVEMRVDLRGVRVRPNGRMYLMSGRLEDEGTTDIATVSEKPIAVGKDQLTVTLPARCIAVIRLDR